MKYELSRIKSVVDYNLSSEKFFEKLMRVCDEERFINEKEKENILYRRMELLQEKLKYYTKNESSSVMEEEAENILWGIDYTIGYYLKSLSMDDSINKLISVDLGKILRSGEKLIKDRVEKNRVLFNQIKANKLNVNNYSYDDTVEYGLSVFFARYDVFFKPHETPCSIDYQLPVDIMSYSGIEYMEKYLKVMDIENKFCNKFKSVDIINILKSYDEKYEELLINIFKLVLTNAVASTICNKEPRNLILNKNDILQIQYEFKELSKEQALKKIRSSLKRCMDILNITDNEIFLYGMAVIKSDEDYIYRNISEGTLENVFIVSKDIKKNEVIEYLDGDKLDDSKFRKYTEEIRACENIKDKIEIINSKFKSLQDLVDMLEADCLFDEEYNVFFSNMTQINIVLLWKVLKEKYIDNENEWCEEFRKYIFKLNKDDLDFIYKNANNIRFIR